MSHTFHGVWLIYCYQRYDSLCSFLKHAKMAFILLYVITAQRPYILGKRSAVKGGVVSVAKMSVALKKAISRHVHLVLPCSILAGILAENVCGISARNYSPIASHVKIKDRIPCLLWPFGLIATHLFNSFTLRVALRSIVCYSHTFENNMGIKQKFTKYL